MDRRTAYSRMVIKDAFLKLLASTPYSQIKVTQICQEADISRSTFYLHFKKINDVLDDVLEEAYANVLHCVDHLLILRGFSEIQYQKEPLCQFIRKNKKYHSLFLDEELSNYVIGRYAKLHKDDYVAKLISMTDLSEQEANTVFWFYAHGCFSVTIHNLNKDDEDWAVLRHALEQVMGRGLFGERWTEL